MSPYRKNPPHPFDNSKKLVRYFRDNIKIDKTPGFRYIKLYDCLYFLNSDEKICDYVNINHKLSVYYGGKPFRNIVGVLVKQVNKVVDDGICTYKCIKKENAVLESKNLDEILSELKKRYNKKEFRPNVFYNKEGDQLEVYLKNNSYVGNYIDPYITTFKMIDENTGEDLDKFMGVEISGIRRMLGNG